MRDLAHCKWQTLVNLSYENDYRLMGVASQPHLPAMLEVESGIPTQLPAMLEVESMG